MNREQIKAKQNDRQKEFMDALFDGKPFHPDPNRGYWTMGDIVFLIGTFDATKEMQISEDDFHKPYIELAKEFLDDENPNPYFSEMGVKLLWMFEEQIWQRMARLYDDHCEMLSDPELANPDPDQRTIDRYIENGWVDNGDGNHTYDIEEL